VAASNTFVDGTPFQLSIAQPLDAACDSSHYTATATQLTISYSHVILAFQSVVDIQDPTLPMGYTNTMAQLAMYFYIAPINMTTLYPGSYMPADMTLLAVSGQSGPAAAWLTLDQIQPAGYPVIIQFDNPTPLPTYNDIFSFLDIQLSGNSITTADSDSTPITITPFSTGSGIVTLTVYPQAD
jgi:hypothetical protein